MSEATNHEHSQDQGTDTPYVWSNRWEKAE